MVIDGHSLAFRAFFALPLENFVNSEGQHTNAIHGFLSMLLKLLQDHKPTHLAVAFDISRFSFRTREYAEYKGTRDETPKEFKGQVPLLEEALHAMGVRTLSKEDYEADDILATLSVEGRKAGMDVFVVSGDRDTIQLVNEDVTLLYPSVRGVSELKHYTPETVRERYGIEPEQYPEIAALVGESSDNLIGIDKVGEKTAVKWITQYGTVENLLAHADEIKGVVGNNLREQRERAERNRRLNKLLTDVDLGVTPDELTRGQVDEAKLRDVFQRLQFRTLLDRVLKQEGNGEAAAALEPEVQAPAVQKLVDEELDLWLSRAKGTVAVSIAPDGAGGIAGFGVATEGASAYVPYKAGTGDYDGFVAWLASDAPKALHDVKASIKVLERAGLGAGRCRSTTPASVRGCRRRPRRRRPSSSTGRPRRCWARRCRRQTRTSSCPRSSPRSSAPSRGSPASSRAPSGRGSTPARSACSTTSSCRSCPCSCAWSARACTWIARCCSASSTRCASRRPGTRRRPTA